MEMVARNGTTPQQRAFAKTKHDKDPGASKPIMTFGKEMISFKNTRDYKGSRSFSHLLRESSIVQNL